MTKTKPQTLPEKVLAYEGKLIKRALRENDNNKVRTARALGLKSHQALSFILNGRQKDLLIPRRGKRRDAGKERDQE